MATTSWRVAWPAVLPSAGLAHLAALLGCDPGHLRFVTPRSRAIRKAKKGECSEQPPLPDVRHIANPPWRLWQLQGRRSQPWISCRSFALASVLARALTRSRRVGDTDSGRRIWLLGCEGAQWWISAREAGRGAWIRGAKLPRSAKKAVWPHRRKAWARVPLRVAQITRPKVDRHQRETWSGLNVESGSSCRCLRRRSTWRPARTRARAG
jgi:hypothetical protein